MARWRLRRSSMSMNSSQNPNCGEPARPFRVIPPKSLKLIPKRSIPAEPSGYFSSLPAGVIVLLST
jgi:hypothetical protein